MNLLNFVEPILPEISLFFGAIVILILDVYFAGNKKEFYKLSYILAILTCFTSLYLVANNISVGQNYFNNMFHSSSFTAMVKFVSISLLILLLILSLEFLSAKKELSAEIIALFMISTVGAMLLISSNDFLTFYLSLELQSLPLYLLAAINKKSLKSSESGMKYFILGSTSSGLLLLGISLFYGFSGTTNFSSVYQLYSHSPIPPAVILGFVLILIAMFFKISAAPFHMWTPDVYEGSHSIVTTFLATVAKFSSVLIFVRIFLDVSTGWSGVNNILILVAIASIIVGSFGAIKQNNIKRLLAYSSVGHIGFVVFGLAAFSLEGIQSCVIYMLIYSFLSIGNFGFLTLISGFKKGLLQGENDEQDQKIFDISSFSGLAKTNPVLAAIFAILMFSTAGIPPLAGFFAKFYIISATIQSGYYVFSTTAILFSVVSAYYYLKIIKVMYFDDPNIINSFKFTKRLAPKLVVSLMAIFNLLFILFLKDFLPFVSTMIGL